MMSPFVFSKLCQICLDCSMQIEVSFLAVLDMLSVATAFMLGLLFLTIKSDNRKANVFLGLFLWSLGVEIFHALMHNFSEEQFLMPHTSLFTLPFLLLYVNETINNANKKRLLFLFIPGLIVNAIFLLKPEVEVVFFFEYLFNIGVLFFILRLLKHHKENVTNYYSDLEHKTLSWIKTIIFIFLGFHVLWIIEDFIGLQNEDYADYLAQISAILTFFMVYWIGYNGFSQPEIFRQKQFFAPEKTKTTPDRVTEVSEESKEEFKVLRARIDAEKLFSNPDLNLQSLAEVFHVKEKRLSKLINQHSGTNFYQFINRFRVNEFKKLMQSPKAAQLSILGLAQEAGFSSKSTFYSAFKTLEGMTPKQYESSLKKSE